MMATPNYHIDLYYPAYARRTSRPVYYDVKIAGGKQIGIDLTDTGRSGVLVSDRGTVIITDHGSYSLEASC